MSYTQLVPTLTLWAGLAIGVGGRSEHDEGPLVSVQCWCGAGVIVDVGRL
ncbi:uncharacterized protein METZ01_LOCUS272851, partial [marine metagenome]